MQIVLIGNKDLMVDGLERLSSRNQFGYKSGVIWNKTLTQGDWHDAWDCVWMRFRREKADALGAWEPTGHPPAHRLQTGPGLGKIVSCLCTALPTW